MVRAKGVTDVQAIQLSSMILQVFPRTVSLPLEKSISPYRRVAFVRINFDDLLFRKHDIFIFQLDILYIYRVRKIPC